MARKTNTNETIIAYLTQLFDGEFSSDFIQTKRNVVFGRIASYTSPKTGKQVGSVLSANEIGEIINNLDNIQFSRRLADKARRLGEGF